MFIRGDKLVIDEVFRRINFTGRKLSNQDLMQAGIISKFRTLVHKTAMSLRGNYSEELITMKDVRELSLSDKGLSYGISVRDTFWIKNGIITENGLRRSKDEEIVAILYACI